MLCQPVSGNQYIKYGAQEEELYGPYGSNDSNNGRRYSIVKPESVFSLYIIFVNKFL